MSQEKMDRYKEAKKNKKEIRKQQQRKNAITKLTWSIVGILFVALIVFLIVLSVQNSKKAADDSTSSGSTVGYGLDFMNSYVPVLDQADQYQSSTDETTETDTTAETETVETETTETATTETETTETETTETETTETATTESETVQTETVAETTTAQ